jgi:hypothetical protein
MSSLALGNEPAQFLSRAIASRATDSSLDSPEHRMWRRDTASRVAGDLAGGDLLRIMRPRSSINRSNTTIVPSRAFSVNDLSSMAVPQSEHAAVESLLLYTARTFGMDLGELWTSNLASSLRLSKLFVAPHFYERYAEKIIYPDADPRGDPSAHHRYSRDLCMRAMMRGEPMWCDVSSVGELTLPGPPALDCASMGAELLPLRTAVVIPFNTERSADGHSPTSSSTAVMVLYSQRHQPLPSQSVMATLSHFSRSVATQGSMARFISTLSSGLANAGASPTATQHSVTDRLGLTSSASLPACLNELDKARRKASDARAATQLRGLASPSHLERRARAHTPSEAPPAPRIGGGGGSTFAQRRMRQMIEHQMVA